MKRRAECKISPSLLCLRKVCYFTGLSEAANRLSTVTGTRLTASYAYNGMGARMRQVTGGITTTYTLDLNAGLVQVLADSDANTYLYGNGRIAQVAGSTTSYFLADHLGSVRQLTNASGAVTLAKGYQPYGSVLSSNGSGARNYWFAFAATVNDHVAGVGMPLTRTETVYVAPRTSGCLGMRTTASRVLNNKRPRAVCALSAPV